MSAASPTELCPICIARAQHGPPLATQIRFLTRERDAAIAETLRMQTLIDELRDEVTKWRDERNEIAARWRDGSGRVRVLSGWLLNDRDEKEQALDLAARSDES